MTQQEFFERYKYSVKSDRIGGGGFGTVYRATDKSLHRKVAIKVSEVKIIGDKEFSLKAEFDAVGNLPVHPNIAHYEELFSFESPQGVFDYAVMQYYEDGNLKNLMDRGVLTMAQKEDIAVGILDGIAFLHRNKVVHRDLKPANILICREGDDYVPLITDFGLSKGVEEMSKSGFSNSIAGGSPGYMSPEQIKGGRMQLNTDLWSYGVMVYELFSGRRLFQSLSPTGSTAEVNEMILHKDISAEIASLPGKWRMVAERCLVRDNRQRAKSAEELHDLLRSGHDKAAIDRSFSVFHLEGDYLVCYVDGRIFLYDITKIKKADDIFNGVCKPVLLGNESNIHVFIRNYVRPNGKTMISYCESLVDYVSAVKFMNRIESMYGIKVIRLHSDLQLIGVEMMNIFNSGESYITVKYRDSSGGTMSECNMNVCGDSGLLEIETCCESQFHTHRFLYLDDDSHLDLLQKSGADFFMILYKKVCGRLVLYAMTSDIVLMSSKNSEKLLEIHKNTTIPFKEMVLYKSVRDSDDSVIVKVGDFESTLRFDKVCKNFGPHMSRFEDFSKFEYVDLYDPNDEESEFKITVEIDNRGFLSFSIVNTKTKLGYEVDFSEIVKESDNDISNSEGYWYIPRRRFIVAR